MRTNLFPMALTLALIALATNSALPQTNSKGASANKNISQAGASPAKPPYFPQLFQNPTNNNGYEEWVQAADLIQNNPEVDSATLRDATLTAKRHLLAEPSVAQALLLLRQGLNKPVGSPHEDYNENTILPELLMFRKLALLLRTQQYVAFADGRVDAAIDSLRLGLAFGYRIQTDNLLNGTMGLAIDNILLDEFAHHFNQLSVSQCGQVQSIVKEFLNAENPVIHLLALEKGYALKMLETRRADANALLNFADFLVTLSAKSGGGDDPAAAANLINLQERLTTRPQDVNAIVDSAQARVSDLYDQALLNARLPLAQRKPFAQDRTDTPDAFLCRLIATDPQRVLDLYTGDQAKLRLLGVHALIHRYRWEHNALPNALTELQSNDLVKDPFTGDQIVYHRDGDLYTLQSQGPFRRDPNGREVSTDRVPVKLIR